MIDLDEHLFISLGGPAPSSGARLKPVWLAITGNRDELGLQLGDQGPGSPAAEGGRPAIGLIRNGDRVFGGRVSFGQGGGASVRTSLPMPHAGRPAPTASPRFAAPPMAIIAGADPNRSYTRPQRTAVASRHRRRHRRSDVRHMSHTRDNAALATG